MGLEAEMGEWLGVKVYSVCKECETLFQLNKRPGTIDYVCPECGHDNYQGGG